MIGDDRPSRKFAPFVRQRQPVTYDMPIYRQLFQGENPWREGGLNEAALRRTHSRVAEPTIKVI